jgi:hypothetical protein
MKRTYRRASPEEEGRDEPKEKRAARKGLPSSFPPVLSRGTVRMPIGKICLRRRRLRACSMVDLAWGSSFSSCLPTTLMRYGAVEKGALLEGGAGAMGGLMSDPKGAQGESGGDWQLLSRCVSPPDPSGHTGRGNASTGRTTLTRSLAYSDRGLPHLLLQLAPRNKHPAREFLRPKGWDASRTANSAILIGDFCAARRFSKPSARTTHIHTTGLPVCRFGRISHSTDPHRRLLVQMGVMSVGRRRPKVVEVPGQVFHRRRNIEESS